MTAFERLTDALRDAGKTVQLNGDKAMAQCPAHDDRRSSLSISLRDDGDGVVLYCHAQCETADIVAALGLSMSDLFDAPRKRAAYSDRNTYAYSDGRKVYRKPGKEFRQSGNTKGDTLFHAERIGDAETVYVPEGEKDVLAIESEGAAAVCSPMGVGKAAKFNWSPLTGKRVIIVADRDEPGRKHAREIAELVSAIAASVQIVEAASGKDAADHIAAGLDLDELVSHNGQRVEPSQAPSEPPDRGHPTVLTRMSNVRPERTQWLWPAYIPAGKLVVLDGDPSVGKSTLSDEFAAVVSTGGRWPDGTACQLPGDVILLSAEDGLADTIRPRLDAAGADVTRVHALQGVRLEDGTLLPPTLADIAMLESAIRQTGARLLVVDVLMAYIPSSTDAHKDQDIRRDLARLAALAERTGCTVLLLRHLNKATGRNPLYRGGGSIGIVGAARAGLLAAFDPDNPDRRVLAMAKSNLAATPPSLGYQLVESGSYGAARVQWMGENGHTARSLLDEPDEPDAATEAERWLEDYVMSEGGSVKSREAKRIAGKAGIAERTLKRAAKTLKLDVQSLGFPRETTWNWPAGQPRSQNLGPTGPTGDDQQEYTPPEAQSGQDRVTGPTGGFIPPTGPDRCPKCGCHVPTQGHKPDCSANEGTTE